jgi:streptogramin lyase
LHEIWVLSQRDQVISVVDTRTHEVHLVPIAGGTAEPASSGYGIVYAFKRIWVSGRDNFIETLDPKDPTTPKRLPFPGDCPSVLARGLGRVWVAMNCPDQVFALNSRGRDVLESKSKSPVFGVGIAVGKGSVWITHSSAVAKVNPGTGKVLLIPLGYPITIGSETGITAPGVASRVAIAFDSVWVSDNVNGVVFKVDPKKDTILDLIHIGGRSAFLGSGIAEGAGSIWVTSPGTDSVVRIDPSDDSIQARIPLPSPPNGLVFADGSVWVTVNPDSQ